MKTYWCLGLVLAASCATADDGSDEAGYASPVGTLDCPTAPKRAVTWWRWATVEDFETLAWSSDDTEILVSEHVYEKKWSIYGYDATRKDCHRLAVYAPDGTRKREVMGLTPGWVPYFPGSLTFMSGVALTPTSSPTAGYAIEHVRSSAVDPIGLWEALRVAPNGERKSLVMWPKCSHGYVIPSPDGSKMAMLTIASSCSDTSKPSVSTVRFLDANGDPIGTVANLPFTVWPVGTWTSAGAFIATDRTTAVRVDVTGTTASVPVPHCTEPSTSSSEVARDGRLAAFVNGKLGVIGVDQTRAFGCQ